jgi:hypothetical protein
VGPPSAPSLSHRGVESDFEITFAHAEPTDVVSYEPIEEASAYAYSARVMVEAAISARDWYVGLAEEVAGAHVPPGETAGTGGATLILSNPELWLRGLWSSELGLSAGGGLALVVPFPRTFTPLETEVVRTVRVVRPWSYAHYQDSGLTVRPFFDVRHVAGPITIQVRQGLDVLFRLRELAPEEARYDLGALLSIYLGLRAPAWLTSGVELSELYLLSSADAPPGCTPPCDEHRAIIVLSPSLRAHLPGFTTGLSLLFPLSTPLRSEVDSFVAGRLHVTLPLGG